MNSEAKKNFLLLGFAIPDEEMEKVFKKDCLPQIQTHKFNWNLIKGLESIDEFDLTYISARPVMDYPAFPKIRINRKKWIENVGGKIINIIEIPFVNISIFKIITRFLSSFYYSYKYFHKKDNKAGIIVYSVHIPFMVTGLLLANIFGIDYIAIWTDPPSVRNKKDSYIKDKLRGLELGFSKFLMRRVSKVIAITKYLAEDFAPEKPYLVMEGIVDSDDTNECCEINEYNFQQPLKIVYTGSLEKRYGIKNIVEGFKLLTNKNVVLDIYGRGDYEQELIDDCKIYKQIRYKGFLPNEEVIKIQRSADFLINARSSDDEYVKYSFPSKTLEYMLSGTPVITTLLPGIPDEYKPYLLILEDNNPETIYNALNCYIKIPIKDRKIIGRKAMEYAKSKNYYEQCKKVKKFLSN